MKLQIALDEQTIAEAIALCHKVRDFVDIIEVGTPFLVRDGLRAVRAIHEAFPEKEILADAKIMDAGKAEAADCFAAGANYVTVLGVTDLLTVQACVEVAGLYHGQMVADMICVRNLPQRVAELEECGITNIAVHTGIDQQHAGRTPLDDLTQIRACARACKISVAGGINLATVGQYIAQGADVVIVGGGIAHAADPAHAARLIADRLRAER